MYQHFEIKKPDTHQELLLKKLINSSLLFEADYILGCGLKLLKSTSSLLMQDQLLVGTLFAALYYADLMDSTAHYGIEFIDKKIQLLMNEYQTQNALQCESIIPIIGQKILLEKDIPFDGTFTNHQEIQSLIAQTLGDVKVSYFESYGILEPLYSEDTIERVNFRLN